METTTIKLPRELNQALADIASRTGRPPETLVREAIELYLAKQDSRLRQVDVHSNRGREVGNAEDGQTADQGEDRRPLPRSIGCASDPDLKAEDIEDWLAANWHPS